ncbi:MAG: galactose-1-phosphate uridylyltransferase [Candidatus Aenigmatarchaeota archaeon]
MNEMRKDYLLNRWVIISEKRGSRPIPEKRERVEEPEFDRNCVFCPGNEDMCPPGIIEKPSSKNWKIRVIENKYPAVDKSEEFTEDYQKFMNRKRAYGTHYLIIDTPKHNLHPGFYTMDEWKMWFQVVKDIFNREYMDDGIEYIMVFKNHGVEAGASKPHPHTQVVSLPVVPMRIEEEMNAAGDYYRFEGKCVFCEVIKSESLSKERVVFEDEYSIAFCPFAPLWPFEVWIFPKEHVPSVQMSKESEEGLLNVLRIVLKTYYKVLDNPPFNFYLHTAYLRMKDHVPQKYHLHIEIAPRLEKDAGFEMGSGINITTVSPETSAKILRENLED